jgi:hypothetical protein
MPGAQSSKTADTNAKTTDPAVVLTERITVVLIPKATADLQHLQEKTGLGKTDVVNRAISLYEFIDENTRGSREVLVRDKETGDMQAVVFL